MCHVDNQTTRETVNAISFRLPSVNVHDKEKIQMGGQGPAFRTSAIVDNAKVRLGGQSPTFRK